MMLFKCVGYDIRYTNPSKITADLMMWDRDEDFYSNIIEKLQLSQNTLQLLNLSEDELVQLSDILKQRADLCLVSIHIPNDIYELYLLDDEYLNCIYVSQQNNIEAYDICDIDGFFSFFDMQKVIKKSIFDDMNLMQKLSLVQFANFKIREHSPFCLVKIMVI